jgi:UDPglucose--hexose-1-phosphate uridylyltransferase
VIIAGERAKRPRQLGGIKDATQAEPCPFCAGNEAMTPPEVLAYRTETSPANSPGWTVRVVPNKYPALVGSATEIFAPDPIYESRHALGTHEVIIESAEHLVNMNTLNVEQMTQILRAYRARMGEMRKDPRWRYTLIYKNQGDRAGATLEHIHSQLIALPAIPAQSADEIDRAKKHYETAGRCIYCDTIERETRAGKRLVLRADDFVALCPFASRFAYETWIFPAQHMAAFERSSDQVLAGLASTMREFIAKLNRALGDPPFNYLIQSILPPAIHRAHYHWRVEILPQVARAAGFEWGTGMHINSVAPEDAARLLRQAVI